MQLPEHYLSLCSGRKLEEEVWVCPAEPGPLSYNFLQGDQGQAASKGLTLTSVIPATSGSLQKRTLKTSEMKIILNWKLAAASQEESEKKKEEAETA